MDEAAQLAPDQILAATAAFFGQPVLKLTAPGGARRSSFRAYFADHTIIVSQRPGSARTRLEALVLESLAPLTDHVPQLLGISGGLVFQSDAGPDRLNWVVHTLQPAERPALAARAIDALFAIQRAAAQTGLARNLPETGGLRRLRGDNLLAGASRFAVQMRAPSANLDPDRLSPWFQSPPQRFIKYDCRAGNAALDPQRHLRWFDFEDARLGHGPEDFAWLMADESWPIAMTTMLDLITSRLSDTDQPEAWLSYLREYAVLQAIRRVRLLFSEARQKGWLDRMTILKYDRVGTNPHMGERLATSAAEIARMTPSVAVLAPLLDQAAEVFRKVRAPRQSGPKDEAQQ